MDDQDPLSIMKMIKEMRSSTDSYRRSGSNIPIRFSGTGYTPPVLSDDECLATSPKRVKLDDSNSILNKSESDHVPGSPWEWRRLKGEIVSLKTRLSHQESAVQQHHKIRREMEEVFQKEKSLLELQLEHERSNIKQIEARLDVARRTIQDAKEAQASAQKELVQVKATLEQKTIALLNENVKLLEDLKHSTALKPEPIPQNNVDLAVMQMKLEAAEARAAQLQEKLRESRSVQQELELKNVEFQNMKIKIEKLESERALWAEGKLLAGRAAKASELEKELQAAKGTIATLRESVKGKLLLEEQMASLLKRLEHTEKMEEQITTLESEKADIVMRLAEYESIGISGGATGLRRELNRLQQAELVLMSEEGQLRSKLDAALRENQDVLRNYEDAKKVAAETTANKEKLGKLVSRLQKKMLLVTRERDSYRQQLDLYEKEITMDNNSVITERIPALERTIDTYREIIAKLEADLEAAENENQREECNKLREEVERLKGEIEHRALKGDFNCHAKVLHFKMNPAAMAEKQMEEKQKSILRELEELRAKAGGGSTSTSSLQAQEIAELKQSHEIKIMRLKDAFKASSHEYRQACYQLFGWRVDRIKEGQYKLSSQYAESPEDFLFFQIGEAGVEVLETAFSATLLPFIEQHLQRQHSVPMFLNAVQADLFAQQTVTNVV